MTAHWRIGTRGSALALWQATTVKSLLEAAGVAPCEIVVIKTDGDRLQDAPLSAIGGKRLFVKEIEDALLQGEVDLAVHSAKDMAVLMPVGLHIAGVLPRADPRDAVVLPAGRAVPPDAGIAALSAVIGDTPALGTSSVRRVAQLHRLFPHAQFLPVRGNVDTRLRKLDAGEYDALILAAAGLYRLDRAGRISASLPVDACVPAPGQGIVAIECRDDSEEITQTLVAISDRAADIALRAERALVEALGGGCQLPLGGHCRATSDGALELLACVTSIESEHEVRALGFGDPSDPEALGHEVAERLIADGAGAILEAVREYDGPLPDQE
ncbi:MAG: hydroxymethylbilane synthase [Acidobacteria bacterium]|nr:hydroxymethylbilane synthase [Acidobacteriota bacterium]